MTSPFVMLGILRVDGTLESEMRGIPSTDNPEPGSQAERTRIRAEVAARYPAGTLVEFEADPVLQADPDAQPLALDGLGRLISHPTLRPLRLRNAIQRKIVALRQERAEILRARGQETGNWDALLADVDADLANARARLAALG